MLLYNIMLLLNFIIGRALFQVFSILHFMLDFHFMLFTTVADKLLIGHYLLKPPTNSSVFATTVFSPGETHSPFLTRKCCIGIIGHGLCSRTLNHLADIAALPCI